MSDSGGYVPLDGKPWRLAMGLRPLREERWIEVDRHRHADLRLKAELLATRHAEVFAALPGSEAASAEVLVQIEAFLDRHHPGLVRPVPDGLHPLDAAGRMVQEDLCLMAHDGPGAWRLVAASLCFPSRWRLADKIGRDLSGIHGPVPGYEANLAVPTAGFFDRLRPERPVWRLNWTLIDRPDLHQPEEAAPAAVGADTGRALWFRVERQTLRRLEDHPAVLFTIRTYVTPLEELVDAYPEAAGALRATLPTVPPETLAYKGWDGLVGDVIAWLEARAG